MGSVDYRTLSLDDLVSYAASLNPDVIRELATSWDKVGEAFAAAAQFKNAIANVPTSLLAGDFVDSARDVAEDVAQKAAGDAEVCQTMSTQLVAFAEQAVSVKQLGAQAAQVLQAAGGTSSTSGHIGNSVASNRDVLDETKILGAGLNGLYGGTDGADALHDPGAYQQPQVPNDLVMQAVGVAQPKSKTATGPAGQTAGPGQQGDQAVSALAAGWQEGAPTAQQLADAAQKAAASASAADQGAKGSGSSANSGSQTPSANQPAATSSSNNGGSGGGSDPSGDGQSPTPASSPSSNNNSSPSSSSPSRSRSANPASASTSLASGELPSLPLAASMSATAFHSSGVGAGGAAGALHGPLSSAPGSGASLSGGSGFGSGGTGLAGAARAGMAGGMMGMPMGGAPGAAGAGGAAEHQVPDYLRRYEHGEDLVGELPVVTDQVIGTLSAGEALDMEIAEAERAMVNVA